MPQEIKPLTLKASIDVGFVEKDLQPWEAQALILQNTGIERDGGITNLYAAIESNTLYTETFYASNGQKIRLQTDTINDTLRVVTGDRDIGQVPRWAVEERKILSVDANDVAVTLTGTILVLRLMQSLATIEEINKTTLARIRARSFVIPADVSDGMFVRNKAPSWASFNSIVGIYQNGVKLNHKIITDAGVVYPITSQLGFLDSSQVFAYYENGWIVAAQDEIDSRTFLLKSTGVQQGTYTEATYLIANHNRGTGAVYFRGWRDVVILGTPATIGNDFTPPVALGGTWTITAITGAASSPSAINMTMGGYALAYGTAIKSLYYHNNTAVTRLWTTGHLTPPEIYGYLDNGADIVFKVHTILGEAAYLSASFAPDGIGTPICEIGEMNAYYYPQIVKCISGDYCIVYRRGNCAFALVTLTNNPTKPRMQEISPGVVKINTISGICIADANDNDLQMGGNAFNGFVVVGFDAVTPVQKAFVARYRGDWGGSVDTNYKSTGAVTVGAVNLVAIPEGLSYTPNNETIDVYVGTLPASINYYRSIRDGIAQTTKGFLQGTLYVDDLIIPPPVGAIYSEQTILLSNTTAIRQAQYDGYQLLNEAIGQYISFRLFGQLYLFDGNWIHSAQTNNNVLQRVDHVANALGLIFIAEAPTCIYFVSTFDNSLYTFDGGQSVNKILRMSRRNEILTGVYNTRENTLALFDTDFVLWLRDGILSQNELPFSYPFEVFSTSDGIWIAKDSYAIKYLYNPITISGGGLIIQFDLDGGIWGTAYADTYDGGIWGTSYADVIDGGTFGTGATGIVEPLVWESKYNGVSDRTRQCLDKYMFRVYQENNEQVTIDIEYKYFIEDGQYTENQSIIIGDINNPYNASGYAYFEFIPAQKSSIASSIMLTCASKIMLLDGYATLSVAGESVTKNRR